MQVTQRNARRLSANEWLEQTDGGQRSRSIMAEQKLSQPSVKMDSSRANQSQEALKFQTEQADQQFKPPLSKAPPIRRNVQLV